MRKQLVLLRVRAESQQVSSQGAMDLLHFFDEARHHSKSDTFLERRVVYHERDYFIHHQRIVGGCASSESHISVVAVWIKSMAFFTRYEVDPLPIL